VHDLPECVILGENEASAEHLYNCGALSNTEMAKLPRDFAIFLANKNEFDFGCTSVCADRSGKPGFFAWAVGRQLCRAVDWTTTTQRSRRSRSSKLDSNFLVVFVVPLWLISCAPPECREADSLVAHLRESWFLEMNFQRATGEERHAADDGPSAAHVLLAARQETRSCGGDFTKRVAFYESL
jgi:hypothetical protein